MADSAKDGRKHHARRILAYVAGVLILFGLAAVGYGLLNQHHAPQPSASGSTAQSQSSHHASPLPASTPVSVSIPAIKVSSPLIQTGLNPDGTPAVPTGANVDKASWLDTSPTPGSKGAAVILGHVDTIKSGPSVFFNLGKMQPGQKVYVARSDGRTAIFTVSAVRTYDKSKFPSQAVYGPVPSPELRLITCGGSWDADSKQYTANIVVFADLTGTS